jgi:hypothetical protein
MRAALCLLFDGFSDRISALPPLRLQYTAVVAPLFEKKQKRESTPNDCVCCDCVSAARSGWGAGQIYIFFSFIHCAPHVEGGVGVQGEMHDEEEELSDTDKATFEVCLPTFHPSSLRARLAGCIRRACCGGTSAVCCRGLRCFSLRYQKGLTFPVS